MSVAATTNMEYAQIRNDPYGVDGMFVGEVSLLEDATAGNVSMNIREKDGASSRWFHWQYLELVGFAALTANRTGRVTIAGKSSVQAIVPQHSVGVQVFFEGVAVPVFSLTGGGGLSEWVRSLGWIGPEAGQRTRMAIEFETDNDDEGTFIMRGGGVYMEGLRAARGLPVIR